MNHDSPPADRLGLLAYVASALILAWLAMQVLGIGAGAARGGTRP